MMDGQFLVEWEAETGKCGQAWAMKGERLLKVLRRNRIFLESACNANGTCGKCRIQVLQGRKETSVWERGFFTDEELDKGYRLACLVDAEPGLKVRLLTTWMSQEDQAGNLCKREDQTACMDKQGEQAVCVNKQDDQAACVNKQDVEASRIAVQTGNKGCMLTQNDLGIAVDLGSTTLAAVLMDAGGTILARASAINSQRAYGADVISRIQAANQGYGKCLQECICKDLEGLFQTLCSGISRAHAHVARIAIAGNTTMLHLLRGYSCQSLGQSPFKPVSIEMECLAYGELFSEVSGCEGSFVYLLPGLSAYVGADIMAGLYSSGFFDTPKPEVACFVDLGTNGEMAVGNRAGFVTASAPAGPAFEGGNLSCGMPGVPGAISNVSFLYHRVRIQTADQKKPCGICGTGALEAVAALKKEGLLDDDGLLVPELFETGLELAKREDGSSICLTQADIREIQMAKAAIRAGLETLLSRFSKDFMGGEAEPESISRVYLAGGFGYYLSADTAIEIGLFPAGWKDKIVPCGNTSLKGAMEFLLDGVNSGCFVKMKEISKKNQSIQLAEDGRFQSLFVERMCFSAS